jgi:hypothetical protein
MTKIRWLTLFREISLFILNPMKPISTLYGQNAELLNVKAGATYKLPLWYEQ